jgi:hypothetical protein
MARIFSIRFAHEGREHHAMISVRQTPFFAEYAVSMWTLLLPHCCPQQNRFHI